MPSGRVLITGIEGFVGSHLARHLHSLGLDVVGLHWQDPVEPLPARLVRGDVRDPAALRALLEETRPQHIIHLAALSSVAISETHSLTAYQVNVIGTLNLLESVRQLNLRCRVLLISSADVYGQSNIGQRLAETDPLRPISAYALSKLMAGEAGRFYHRVYGIDIVILLPFSHTGPGQSPSFVFAKVACGIARAEVGAALPVIEMGNLDVRRDYADVRDVVRAYGLALDRCRSGDTYNVTSGRPVLLREAVAFLCSLARVKIDVRSATSHFRSRDIPLLTGDPAKFQAATGWRPEIPFEQTLTDLLDYYRSKTDACPK
uniref:NAD-dependent epimerase/dehydratase family protein n=1 Tax=candidate division WOR-3 bacterium TaxID=2052148 RepID=A0A7C4GER6_UNCW3